MYSRLLVAVMKNIGNLTGMSSKNTTNNTETPRNETIRLHPRHKQITLRTVNIFLMLAEIVNNEDPLSSVVLYKFMLWSFSVSSNAMQH